MDLETCDYLSIMYLINRFIMLMKFDLTMSTVQHQMKSIVIILYLFQNDEISFVKKGVSHVKKIKW